MSEHILLISGHMHHAYIGVNHQGNTVFLEFKICCCPQNSVVRWYSDHCAKVVTYLPTAVSCLILGLIKVSNCHGNSHNRKMTGKLQDGLVLGN